MVWNFKRAAPVGASHILLEGRGLGLDGGDK